MFPTPKITKPIVEPKPELVCAQCKERLDPAQTRIHREGRRVLCTDCAYGDMPHTD